MARPSTGLHEQKTISVRARARCSFVIVVSVVAACALIAEASCGFVMGSSSSAAAKRPQRSVNVYLRNYAVGDRVEVLRSDKTWACGTVKAIMDDGSTHVGLDGSSSMKAISSERVHIAIRTISQSGQTAAAGTAGAAGAIGTAGAHRDLDTSERKYILASIRRDLEHQFSDGFIYTPFSPDVSSSNPFLVIRGRITSSIMKKISPLSALHNFMAEDAATFHIKSIVETAGDVDPFDGIASPPRGHMQVFAQAAAWAVHAVWEIEAQGRIQLSPLIEQKPFYLSGHEVFRMDESGRVISHERGFDQDLLSVAAYFNPIHHVPSLDSILPISVARKVETQVLHA